MGGCYHPDVTNARSPLALFTLLLLPACGGDADRAAVEGPNVLLLVVDTLRADHLTPYGGDARTSPNLDRLAEGGTLFLDCRASSPWTLPSMASIFTGLYPRSHGAGLSGVERSLKTKTVGSVPQEGVDPAGLRDGVETLAATFRRAGYDTFLRATNPFLSYGLEEDFEEVKIGFVEAEEVVEWGLERLRKSSGRRPFMMALHFLDTHAHKRLGIESLEQELDAFAEEGVAPLTADLRGWRKYDDDPASFRPDLDRRFRMYEVCTRYVDRQIGRLLEELEVLDLGPTYVVVTSDHGEDFRDHWDVDRASRHHDPRKGWEGILGIGHGHNLHGSVTHVPLIISGLGVPLGRRVERRCGIVDILPTLCELADLPLSSSVHGRSLVPLMHGDVAPAAYIAESLAYGREKTAYFALDGMLLIEPQSDLESAQLFDTSVDSGEQHDLIAEQPERAAVLRAELEAFVAGAELGRGQEHTATGDILEDMRDLGYAGDD